MFLDFMIFTMSVLVLCLKVVDLCRYPHMRVCSQLVDAHLYLLKKWVIDYLKKNK